MNARITINMDNAAFQEDEYPELELSRILEKLSKGVLSEQHISVGCSIPLRDINGNKVGDLTIDE